MVGVVHAPRASPEELYDVAGRARRPRVRRRHARRSSSHASPAIGSTRPRSTSSRSATQPIDPATGAAAGTVHEIDAAAGTIDLLRGPSRQGTHPAALIPSQPFDTKLQREALGRSRISVLASGIDGPGAVPRRSGSCSSGARRGSSACRTGAALAPDGDDDVVAAARRIALALDQTVLPIQGPPGSGKTYTGRADDRRARRSRASGSGSRRRPTRRSRTSSTRGRGGGARGRRPAASSSSGTIESGIARRRASS